MRNKQELDNIALLWAYENISCWQDEIGSWDMIIEDENLTDEEWEYCRNKVFNITIED